MPTFSHAFWPPTATTLGSTADLTVREIEDAGLREVLQTPGPLLGHWGILDALLDSRYSDFRFLEPLGQAREVKVAISGLFGRFVARAYVTRHLGLSHYAHIRSPPMRLTGVMHGELRRVPGASGDMPDWVAWGPRRGLAIVEAKGCHDRLGAGRTLDRAYAQAERAEIRMGRRMATFKRFAIATRWGFSAPLNWQPFLWVKDPEEQGEPLSSEEDRELRAGVIRLHCSALLDRLDHPELAAALRDQAAAPARNLLDRAEERARSALDRARPRRVEGSLAVQPEDELVGGFVIRGGTVSAEALSGVDPELLRRLDLRRAFVGIERRMLKLAISGDVDGVERERVASVMRVPDGAPSGPRDDGSGSWIIRLDEDAARVA